MDKGDKSIVVKFWQQLKKEEPMEVTFDKGDKSIVKFEQLFKKKLPMEVTFDSCDKFIVVKFEHLYKK